MSTSNKTDNLMALVRSDETRSRLAALLPKHLPPETMLEIVHTALTKAPKLRECIPQSIVASVVSLASFGLAPDGRYAHLIPRWNKNANVFVAGPMVDYKGYIRLAKRAGLKSIASDVVCQNDHFVWQRTESGLKFEHCIDYRKDRGEVYAAYCIWKEDDDFDGEVMSVREIDDIRARSQSPNDGPWVTDTNEMRKKTVVRRASKRWPLTSEQHAAVVAEAEDVAQQDGARYVDVNVQPPQEERDFLEGMQKTDDLEQIPPPPPPPTPRKKKTARIRQPDPKEDQQPSDLDGGDDEGDLGPAKPQSDAPTKGMLLSTIRARLVSKGVKEASFLEAAADFGLMSDAPSLDEATQDDLLQASDKMQEILEYIEQ